MLPPGRYTLSAKIGGGSDGADPHVHGDGRPPAAARRRDRRGRRRVGAPRRSGVPAATARRGGRARAATLSFAKPRFSTSTVLDAGFVAPLIDRLAARPDAGGVRDALERAKAGPWPTDSAKGPLAAAPLAAHFVAGLGRLQAGDLEEAAQAFRAALKVAPDFAPALIYLGACYAAGAKDQEAAGAWQMALVRERTSPDLQRLAIEAWLRADKPARGAGPAQPGAAALARRRRVRAPAGAGRARRRAAAGRPRSRRAAQAAGSADAAARRSPRSTTRRGARRRCGTRPAISRRCGGCAKPYAAHAGRIAGARRRLADRDGAGSRPVPCMPEAVCW